MRFSTILVAALLAAGSAAAADSDAAAAQAAAPAPTVTVVPAARTEVQARVPLSGTLVARREVHIFPQVAGFEIVALEAEEGDRVEAGQELARLSDTTLRARLAQADAEYQRAEAGVGQAESQIASAEAALTQAVTALDRARSLRTSGNTSQAALDQAVAAEAAAQAAAQSARGGLAVAKAALAQAEAARDIASLDLERTRILSPVDGLVGARSAELGALSSAAGEPMFRLVADGLVEVVGEVIETALPQLRRGDKAELIVAGVGPVTGEVRALPAAVDPQTRLGQVRITLPEDERLRIGLFASGDIVTDRREAVTVPSTAVLADEGGERVQVVRDDGVVETRGVRAGLLWDGRREILEGLDEGERVIARAGAFFRSGDAVNPVPEGSAAVDGKAIAGQPVPQDTAAGTAQTVPAGQQAAPARAQTGGAMTASAAEPSP